MTTQTMAVSGTGNRAPRNSPIGNLLALLSFALLLGADIASAAGGYTYTQVRQFPSSDPNNLSGPPENLCDIAMNDLGHVAYVTIQTNSDGTQTENVHTWTSAGTDQIIYSAMTDALLNPLENYPYCGGIGGNSLGLAIDNQGIVSAQVFHILGGNATIGYQYNYGLLFVDSGLIDHAPVDGISNVLGLQLTPTGSGSGALTGNHANGLGLRPYVDLFDSDLSASTCTPITPMCATTSQPPLTSQSPYQAASTVRNPLPAINDAGQISILGAQVSGGSAGAPTLIDVSPSGGLTFTSFSISWSLDGALGMNNRGDAAFMTTDAFRVVEQPANRSAAPVDLVDYLTFTQSVAARAVSFSDWSEATFTTTDAGAYAGLWSIAADGTPVEVFSGLDPAFNVFNPLTQTTTNLVPSGYLAANVMEVGTGNFSPSAEIVANNHGAVLFLGPRLVVATPLKGLRPSVPLPADSTDPTTSLMTFNKCASLYIPAAGFLTPALTFGPFTGTCYVNAALAANYTLTVASGADNFQSVTIPAPLPGGQTTFGVSYVLSTAPAGAAATQDVLTAGQIFKFPSGVSTFNILGINTAQALNSNAASAFVVGLAWVNSGVSPTGFTMQPLTDTVPPAITPVITGTAGTNGWYTSNVTVTWTVTDPLAPIISQTGCGTTTISADTTGQVVTCTAVGRGGTNTQSVTIKRDATPPAATATPSPLPNASGWNNTPVTISFSGTDGLSGSGIASCTAPITLSGDGASQNASGTCADLAGNTSATATQIVNIDRTPPSATITTPANGASYPVGAVVTASYQCADALSGVPANQCVGTVPLGSNIDTLTAGNKSFSVTATDRAGNVGPTALANYTVTAADTTPPVINPIVIGTLGQNGWYVSNVAVTWSVTDPESAVTSTTGCGGSSVLSDTNGVTFTCRATSTGGTSQQSITIRRDTGLPQVVIAWPLNGLTFNRNAKVPALYLCVDFRSGIAQCSGTVPSGSYIDTASAGTKFLIVTGRDRAGNTIGMSVQYKVH
jgi:hypothetical protein